jgi:trimeric autotransporter adhesin
MKKIILTFLLLSIFQFISSAQIPTIVKNININDQSAYPGSFPEFLTSFNGNVYFTAITNPLNSSTYSLYKSDGTENGTSPIKNLQAFAQSIGQTNFTIFNNELYFTVNNSQLWKSDGSTSGTVLLKNHTNLNIASLYEANGFLFYRISDNLNLLELWRTDGSASGTIKLTPTNTKVFSAFGKFGNKIFFNADNGLNGGELWASDGTVQGTSMLMDISPGLANSNPSNFFEFNNKLYFFTWFGLWKTDGAISGTVSVKNNIYISQLIKANFMKELNGNIYFRASTTANSNEELWKSDGTEMGTILVKDINSGTSTSDIKNLIVSNGLLYFDANDGVNGRELWKSDGTTVGTIIVKDINPGAGNSIDNSFQIKKTFFANNGTVYFSANNGTNGFELWKSDGTEVGTVMVADINPGAGSSTPDGFEKYNNNLLFSADNGVNGRELWKMSLVPEPTVYINSTPILSNFAGQGETKVPFYIFSLESKNVGSSLSQINLRTAGGYSQSDILNFKLFKNNIPNLIGAQQIANLSPTMGVPEVLNFVINENLAANTPVYFIATADISPNAYLSPTPNDLQSNAHVKSTLFTNPLNLFFVGNTPSIVDNQPFNQSITFDQKYELTKGFFIKNPQFTIDGTASATNTSSKAYVSLVQNGAVFKTVEIINGSYNLGSVYDGIYDLVLHKTASGSTLPQLPDGFTSFTAERFDSGPTDAVADGKIRVQISGDYIGPARINTNQTVIFELAAAPLPIRLLSFAAKQVDKVVNLNWRTSTETNFSHFEIQKSEANKEFGTIGKVTGNNQSNYNFTDTNPTEGNNYYRLKMVDLDGSSAFSKTISVNYEKNGYYLSIENPAKNGEFMIKANYPKPSFSMVNSIGKKLEILVTEFDKNTFKIKVKNTTTGIYFLSLESEGKLLVSKVLME